MKCEVKGRPIPKIRWYKNEAPLEEERGKVDVRKLSSGYGKIGSRLRIMHVDIHDTGYYKCEATNDKHTVETTGILMVKAGKNILLINFYYLVNAEVFKYMDGIDVVFDLRPRSFPTDRS
ncbi:hypothetical protein AVEN_153411-1 [Araneus ventricosus]|uniref:Ig-like domain-containing protein n=1 Tax=Araneus ventricosus TaxID=182803 RepID=A0A4Y2EB36_ARAVE|nr:hypothetical protein AVEN_153411-1 [Araneus ventricosus]